MRDQYVTVPTRQEARRLNALANEAEAALRNLDDAIVRLENIRDSWRIAKQQPSSISFNNAAGRVADAAFHTGAVQVAIQAAWESSEENLLIAFAGKTFFTSEDDR